jgi:FlaA1/EpsC-like NDP-sugar epimerase
MEDYEGKIVLVTGGAGCIGTNKLFFQTLRKFNQNATRKETFTKEMKRNLFL